MADWGPHQYDRIGDAKQAAITPGEMPGAGAHTKGSWGTFSGGNTTRCDGLFLMPTYLGVNSSRRTVLMDVGVGATPNIIINNLMVCPINVNASNMPRVVAQQVFFPISVPEGYTLQARAQSSIASHPTIYLEARPCASGLPCVGSIVDTYGADTVSSKGTTLTASNTEAAWGAWSEIVSSSERIKALVVALGHGQAPWNTYGEQWKTIQIGIGAQYSETALFSIDSIGASSGTETPSQAWFGPYYVDIPAGTRISARHATQYSSSAQRTIDVILYGIR